MNKPEKHARAGGVNAPRVRNLCQVRCNGKIHTLEISDGGPIVLRDHSPSEIMALRTLRTMGDTTCRCLDMLDFMKGRDPKTRKETSTLPTWTYKRFIKEEDWNGVLTAARARRELRGRLASRLETVEGRYLTRYAWMARDLKNAALNKTRDELGGMLSFTLPGAIMKHDAYQTIVGANYVWVKSIAWQRLSRLGLGHVDNVIAIELKSVAALGTEGLAVEYLAAVKRTIGDVMPLSVLVAVNAVATRRTRTDAWNVRLRMESGATCAPDALPLVAR